MVPGTGAGGEEGPKAPEPGREEGKGRQPQPGLAQQLGDGDAVEDVRVPLQQQERSRAEGKAQPLPSALAPPDKTHSKAFSHFFGFFPSPPQLRINAQQRGCSRLQDVGEGKGKAPSPEERLLLGEINTAEQP